MVLGMVTIINVTMVGAVMQLAGQIPDGSLLVILSRYLGKKGERQEALLAPLEASARLRGLRRRTGALALAACAPGLAFTVWASLSGRGALVGAALAFWTAAGNLAFLTLPLASLERRARRMRPEEGADLVNDAGERRGSSPSEKDEVREAAERTYRESAPGEEEKRTGNVPCDD